MKMAPIPSEIKPNFQECFKTLQELMEYLPKLNIMDPHDPKYKVMYVKYQETLKKFIKYEPILSEVSQEVSTGGWCIFCRKYPAVKGLECTKCINKNNNDQNNTGEIIKCIDENKFENLMMYNKFYLEKIFDNCSCGSLEKLFINCKDNKIIKYFIDNIVDLEDSTPYGWKLIHYICEYSTPEMIKYIIDKGVDLECADNDGWKPIHLICKSSTLEMIKYISNKGVDLECVNDDGLKPIHYICKQYDLEC